MKFNTIMEQLIKEAEEKQQLAALDQAMGMAFKAMGAELQSNQDELKQDVQNADIELKESITVATVVGMLLAAPKVVELITKGFSKLVSVFKKVFPRKGAQTAEEQNIVAEKIVEFTHKWHQSYVKGLKWILKVTGMFDKAGIKGDSAQTKAAEMIYYTLIASLAVYSGVGAVSAFKSAIAAKDASQFSLAALETAMASIKTGEVAAFVGELGLKS
jgi:hypothetical protein